MAYEHKKLLSRLKVMGETGLDDDDTRLNLLSTDENNIEYNDLYSQKPSFVGTLYTIYNFIHMLSFFLSYQLKFFVSSFLFSLFFFLSFLNFFNSFFL